MKQISRLILLKLLIPLQLKRAYVRSITVILFFSFLPFLNAQMCPCQFGQSDTDKLQRFEVGANLYNINEELINFYNPGPVYLSNAFNGAMIKYHFNTFSLRAGFDFLRNNYDYSTGDTINRNKNSGKSKRYDLRLGVEKSAVFGKLRIFALADIVYALSEFSGITEGIGNQIPAYRKPYNFKTAAIGLNPGFGFSYRPLKHFSVTLETSVAIVFYRSRSSDGVYPDESSSSDLFNPLRVLSLNYHFGL